MNLSGNPNTTAGNTAGASEKPKVPVSIESFLLGFKVPFDVYTKEGSGYSCVLRKWTKFDQDVKTSLKSKGILYLYVEGDPSQVREFFKAPPAASAAAAKPAEPDYTSYTKTKDEFHHVSKLVFAVGSKVNFSIYNNVGTRFAPLIETAADRHVPVMENIKAVSGGLAIKVSDIKLFREYIFGLSKTSSSDSSAVQAKIAGIKEGAKMNIRDFLSDPGSPKNIDGVVISANQIISVLRRKEATLSSMLTVNAGDMHLYNHSTNVAVMSTAIALAMGMDQGQIEKLAIGAMMHDVGKKNLQSSILHKREVLTNEEFSMWKKHVTDGISIIQNNGIPRDAIVGVQQHHERVSGLGYPFGLKGIAITPFGKILSLVDCYDALTTRRPFKQPLTPFAALEKILKETADKGNFDPELVKLLVKILKGQGRI
ncbi:MAG: HD-GYP domain-containing protein [Nitrospirae bacterium]|nr:MAG: HD-GYP domain-containing protein [Nitrospirota bacterium]